MRQHTGRFALSDGGRRFSSPGWHRVLGVILSPQSLAFERNFIYHQSTSLGCLSRVGIPTRVDFVIEQEKTDV
jgi:hypothetical protein